MTSSSANKPYPNVASQAKYPVIEEAIIKHWKENKIFERSVEARPAGKNGENEFVFYDGPPFANGLPHYGHFLTGYVKDVVPRFQTMRGKRVERRFGWDCHGLPPEMEAEKELKVSGRQAIQQFGIDKFNSHCKTAVMRYTKEWESFVSRQARWVDFKNDYKTMDLSYMESILWAFKELYKKGLIYEGFRVMPYSWACETPLSNFETRMDNATRPRQDPAVTVAFTLHPKAGEQDNAKILVWTTTPWTLPSNLALAVGEKIEYAIMQDGTNRYIIAEAVLKKYELQLKNAQKVGTLTGKDLVGRTYEPLFPYFKNTKDAFKVLAGDFVATEEGTGTVHMAPGFGEDDFKLCQSHNIPVVCPVDDRGCFTKEVPDYVGIQVFEANKDIIKVLKERGHLIRHDSYTHNYPHCWRTDTPIIYRAMNSWYVRVSEIKNRMSELNQTINWVPGHIKDGQFGKGIENAPDWSISRNRFWGTPIPVWKSDDPKYPRIDVYGSVAELEKDFGVKVNDLHRPMIDQLTRPNPDDPTGKSTMRRITDVLDCWFESGSMPFAQVHYPFENKEWFENHFPGDFIVEYVAQTRGWFYTLMVLGTALFDKAPFTNCVCHGVVLGDDGQKLSKRLKNYPNPEEVFSTVGADALRWYLMSSAVLKGGDIKIERQAISETVRTALNPIWNVYYFFTLYANSDNVKAVRSTKSKELLDRYILAKTRELIEETTEAYEKFDLAEACRLVTAFLDALNNWYVRRSRERFWKHEKDQDKTDAYNTLFTVLETLCKIIAPMLPMISEEVYRGITNGESVHLANWPNAADYPSDHDLVATMDKIREVCSVGLSIRENHNLRTRLPLKSATIAGNNLAGLKPYSALIRDELNLKEINFAESFTEFATYQLQVNARTLGPKIGGKVQDVIKAAKQGNWKLLPDGSIDVAGTILAKSDFTLGIKAKEGVAAASLTTNDAVVVIDIVVTPELEAEGVARDVVRMVQQARRDAGLHVADHIKLGLILPAKVATSAKSHSDYIKEQTLTDELLFEKLSNATFSQELELGDDKITLQLLKV